MKSIKEKQMIVKWAKAMNEPVDPAILEEVENHEKLLSKVKESVRSNLANDLKQAAIVAKSNPIVEAVKPEYDKPPSLDEVLALYEETIEQVSEQVIELQPEITNTTEKSIIDLAVSKITEEEIRNKDSFQQPNPAPVDKNLNDIQKKLKFLEQAIGRIAAHGPGSGETRFLNLDDFTKGSYDRDRHKILKINPAANPAYDGVGFGFLTGDQGPIYSMKYDTTGYTGNANVGGGLTAWNPVKDCLDIYQSDNTILQVGLESYVRVANETGNSLQNGEFVVFTGTNGTQEDPVPKVGKFLADANAIPLYAVGVLTNDISDNTIGRATVLGEVRNLNTTGNVVGETWYAGNLLWAHPAIPGKLTVTQPTAPNVAVSVAAVLKADASDGVLLVRPTLAPRLFYGSFVSTQTQTAPNTTSRHAVTFNRTEFASGFVIENSSRIKALNAGFYKFDFNVQLTSTNSAAKNVYIWAGKNGVNVEDSSSAVSVVGNGTNLIASWSFPISLNKDDYFELFWGTDNVSAFISSPTVPSYSPNIPPVLLTVTQAAL